MDSKQEEKKSERIAIARPEEKHSRNDRSLQAEVEQKLASIFSGCKQEAME